MLLTIVYFAIALFLLVTIHEYGHFLVARLCGVKVLRFSFGFGKVLARWHDKRGTEYAWSLLPLGGYVKMLDEEIDEVPENEHHLAFNNQSLLVRVAIVIAGPLFNFIFAFVALWLALVIGMQSLAPMIDAIKPDSLASRAGFRAHEEIISLDDKPIASWHDFQYAMMSLIGSDENAAIQVKSLQSGVVRTIILPAENWKLDGKRPDPLGSLGIKPFIPAIPPVVGFVAADSPAQIAGIFEHDRILTVNGKACDDWLDLAEYTHQHPGKKLSLTILRGKQQITIPLTIASKDNDGKQEGFIGVRPQKPDWPDKWLRFQRQDPLTAFGTALRQTVELSSTTLTLIVRFVSGKLPLQNLSGPVGIAQGAGDSGRNGMASYLFFLALVSISLGVLNLLPIPLLDGGHLLFYFIEFIMRRPLSDVAKSTSTYIGLAFLLMIMVLALHNDIARLSAT